MKFLTNSFIIISIHHFQPHIFDSLIHPIILIRIYFLLFSLFKNYLKNYFSNLSVPDSVFIVFIKMLKVD